MPDYRKLTDTEKRILALDASADLDMSHVIIMGKAMLTIAGADGTVPEAEMLAFWQFMTMGVDLPEFVREELKNFDYKSANLDELISQVKEHPHSREGIKRLVAGAIMISMSDDQYHEKEKAAVLKFAKEMGITEDIVVKMEAMLTARLALIKSNMMIMASL